jgi:small subunit ribosomal protein S18
MSELANKPAAPKKIIKKGGKKKCIFCIDVSNKEVNINKEYKDNPADNAAALKKAEKAAIVDTIDYMNVELLRKYVTEKGKMLPARMTGICSYHQRMLAEAIKRARVMALLPFSGADMPAGAKGGKVE